MSFKQFCACLSGSSGQDVKNVHVFVLHATAATQGWKSFSTSRNGQICMTDGEKHDQRTQELQQPCHVHKQNWCITRHQRYANLKAGFAAVLCMQSASSLCGCCLSLHMHVCSSTGMQNLLGSCQPCCQAKCAMCCVRQGIADLPWKSLKSR